MAEYECQLGSLAARLTVFRHGKGRAKLCRARPGTRCAVDGGWVGACEPDYAPITDSTALAEAGPGGDATWQP